MLYEQIGSFDAYNIQFNDQRLSLERDSGWIFECLNIQLNQHLDVKIELTDDGTSWINPLGFSGRSSEIMDSTGIRIHHIELSRINPTKA